MSIELSVVVPVYNEEESLPHLHAEIAASLDGMGLRRGYGENAAEILFVNDHSGDQSLEVMLDLQSTDSRVRVIHFRRNFGQTAAMAAGFDESRGRIVVTMDADLQNDPADIPRLLAKLDEGFDVVAGWRKVRHDGFVLRRLPSIMANRLIGLVTGVRIHDTGCTLKAFRRELVKSMSIYAEQHRFLPVLSAGSGARVAEIVVNHRARQFGESKYGIGRATRVLLDLFVIKMISQFSHRPLQYFGMLAMGATLLSGVFGLIGLFGAEGGGPALLEEGVHGIFALNEWEMAICTVLALSFSLAIFFGLLGLLGELAVKASGMHRRSTLDRILNELH